MASKSNKKPTIKETLLASIGQQFLAGYKWYRLLGVSQDGKTAFVRYEKREQIDAKSAYDYLQATPIAQRRW